MMCGGIPPPFLMLGSFRSMTISQASDVCRLAACISAAVLVCFLALPQTSSAALPGSSMRGSQTPPSGQAGVPLLIQNLDISRLGRAGMPDISVSYPSVGVSAIDEDIAAWVNHIVFSFERDFSGENGLSDKGDAENRYSLSSTYRVIRPSPAALSVVFELWMDTGGVHPGLDVITLNYSLISEQRLSLVDVFEDTARALDVMSGYSRSVLAVRVGGGRVDQAIASGTAPDPDNFANIALIPGGVRVYFQPYQVAPWSAGTQIVDIPLEKLKDARPLMDLWGRQ